MKRPYYARLTKAFLMELPESLYLVSNCLRGSRPVFEETVRPAAEREQQWKAIVAARANGRLCYVFHDAEELRQHLARITFPPDRRPRN